MQCHVYFSPQQLLKYLRVTWNHFHFWNNALKRWNCNSTAKKGKIHIGTIKSGKDDETSNEGVLNKSEKDKTKCSRESNFTKLLLNTYVSFKYEI